MNPAYSVILFTTASGAGYGLLALLGLVGFNHGQASSVAFALTTLAVALLLITLGLLSSTLHLGHPERAWRALSQWRSSWLSREGVAAVATYPVALLFGLAWAGFLGDARLVGVLGLAASFMSVTTVYCTGKIYSTLKTIRAWNHALTVPIYLVFAIGSGAAILMAVATVFGRFQVAQLVIAGVSLAIVAICKFFYWRSIDTAVRVYTTAAATGLGEHVRQWEVPHTGPNFIMKEMGFAVARKHAVSLRKLFFALLAAVAVAYVMCLVSPWFSILAVPAILFAAWVERWLFFAEAEHVVNVFYGKAAA
jgi:sulfite dehydrogenase (quinone) subunit SoeC